MISIQNISKSFGLLKALDRISIDIHSGEIIGLLGPNGAGKTTLMRILSGVLEPEQGSYAVNGVDVFHDSMMLKQRLGYLAENNPLPEDLGVREYLEWIAELRVAKLDRQAAVDRALAATELQPVAHRPIGELSKGYRQRVGLSQAILSDPDLLILDEPTEGLDPNQRVDIRSLIKNLGQRKTVLVSTHVLSEVADLCSRILIIDRGMLVADGTMANLQAQVNAQRQLWIEIEGANVNDAAVLAVEGVLQILKKEQRDQRWAMTLAVDSTHAVAPNLFRLAKQAGWTLWELHQEPMNLEQLFRHLTQAS